MASPPPTRAGNDAETQRRKHAVAYGTAYRKARAALHLEDHPPCHWCGQPATTADHYPPLAHIPTPTHPRLVPACAPCNYSHRAHRHITHQQHRAAAQRRITETLATIRRITTP